MDKEFVPYELAVKLKALGFDKKCITTIDQTNYIHTKGTRRPIRGAMVYNTIDCPTFSQAFRWFRDKYELFSSCDISNFADKTYGYVITSPIPPHYLHDVHSLKSMEEAELACLTKLIEIVKHELNKSF